jgi:hypothetical protein
MAQGEADQGAAMPTAAEVQREVHRRLQAEAQARGAFAESGPAPGGSNPASPFMARLTALDVAIRSGIYRGTTAQLIADARAIEAYLSGAAPAQLAPVATLPILPAAAVAQLAERPPQVTTWNWPGDTIPSGTAPLDQDGRPPAG